MGLNHPFGGAGFRNHPPYFDGLKLVPYQNVQPIYGKIGYKTMLLFY